MKKYLFILFIFITLFFISCNNDIYSIIYFNTVSSECSIKQCNKDRLNISLPQNMIPNADLFLTNPSYYLSNKGLVYLTYQIDNYKSYFDCDDNGKINEDIFFVKCCYYNTDSSVGTVDNIIYYDDYILLSMQFDISDFKVYEEINNKLLEIHIYNYKEDGSDEIKLRSLTCIAIEFSENSSKKSYSFYNENEDSIFIKIIYWLKVFPY